MEWPEDYDMDETLRAMKRVGTAIIHGTVHTGNGEWLVRLADALLLINPLEDEPYDDRPNGEMQPIIDSMEAGDMDEERYEAHFDWEEDEPDFPDDEEDASPVLGDAETYRQAPEWEQDEDSLRDLSE